MFIFWLGGLGSRGHEETHAMAAPPEPAPIRGGGPTPPVPGAPVEGSRPS
jgi:hypothetical protein